VIYDEYVDPAKIIGANRVFLERELPHIASLMRLTLEKVVQEVEVIVIANGSDAFHCVPQLMRENQILIDLLGVAKSNYEKKGEYEGICW
jgi:GDP-mannose 6-dehydrogenase